MLSSQLRSQLISLIHILFERNVAFERLCKSTSNESLACTLVNELEIYNHKYLLSTPNKLEHLLLTSNKVFLKVSQTFENGLLKLIH